MPREMERRLPALDVRPPGQVGSADVEPGLLPRHVLEPHLQRRGSPRASDCIADRRPTTVASATGLHHEQPWQQREAGAVGAVRRRMLRRAALVERPRTWLALTLRLDALPHQRPVHYHARQRHGARDHRGNLYAVAPSRHAPRRRGSRLMARRDGPGPRTSTRSLINSRQREARRAPSGRAQRRVRAERSLINHTRPPRPHMVGGALQRAWGRAHHVPARPPTEKRAPLSPRTARSDRPQPASSMGPIGVV